MRRDCMTFNLSIGPQARISILLPTLLFSSLFSSSHSYGKMWMLVQQWHTPFLHNGVTWFITLRGRGWHALFGIICMWKLYQTFKCMLSLLEHTIRATICIHINTLHTHYNSPSLREDREHEVGSCHKQCSWHCHGDRLHCRSDTAH